jgi:hypothetical protein
VCLVVLYANLLVMVSPARDAQAALAAVDFRTTGTSSATTAAAACTTRPLRLSETLSRRTLIHVFPAAVQLEELELEGMEATPDLPLAGS